MSKQVVSRVFYIGFFVIFGIMTAIMVKGLIDQNKDEKQQTARYESMITEGQKTVLTNEILNEDHDKFVQDSIKGKKTFITLLVCFASVIVLFVITYIFTIILKGMEEGASTQFIIILACFVVTLLMIGFFAVVAVKTIVPKLSNSDPETEKYYFNELRIKDAEKEEKTETVKSGDSYETRTTVYYYLIEENGNRISVNKVLFSRFVGEGIYYAGQTERGAVFSVYPDKYFELP